MPVKSDQVPWLQYQWRKLARPTIVTLDGLRVSTDPSFPSGICRALYRGDYERPERKLVASVLRRDDRVLDIGTGLGVVAATCGSIARDGAMLCYEANPRLLQFIEKNFALNEIEAEVRNRAVTVDGEPVEFFFDDNIVSSSLIDRERGLLPERIESDSFEQVVSSFGPHVIVMDVEGAEVDLLPSADLQDVRAIVLEVHPHIVGADAIDRMTSRLAEVGLNADPEMHAKNTIVLRRGG
ncbi:MAG: FkbM family methyltransferase [Pseudomonadota bacterium]